MSRREYPVWMYRLPVEFWVDEEVLEFIREAGEEALNNGKTDEVVNGDVEEG